MGAGVWTEGTLPPATLHPPSPRPPQAWPRPVKPDAGDPPTGARPAAGRGGHGPAWGFPRVLAAVFRPRPWPSAGPGAPLPLVGAAQQPRPLGHGVPERKASSGRAPSRLGAQMPQQKPGRGREGVAQDPLLPGPPGRRPSDIYTLEGRLPEGGEHGPCGLSQVQWTEPRGGWGTGFHPAGGGRDLQGRRAASAPGRLVAQGQGCLGSRRRQRTDRGLEWAGGTAASPPPALVTIVN